MLSVDIRNTVIHCVFPESLYVYSSRKNNAKYCKCAVADALIVPLFQTGSLVPMSISEAGFRGIRDSNQDIAMPVREID